MNQNTDVKEKEQTRDKPKEVGMLQGHNAESSGRPINTSDPVVAAVIPIVLADGSKSARQQAIVPGDHVATSKGEEGRGGEGGQESNCKIKEELVRKPTAGGRRPRMRAEELGL